ncbi:MAG: hypothetical protein JO148_15420 [Acidimicrobiia bacterium]|nr:hypothetical protein [Acidimicrobiia bacterium]
MNDQDRGGRTVIDLRTGRRSDEQRILELAGPSSDPGWIAGVLNREGLPSPAHRPWSPEDVLAVLSHGRRTPA